MADDSASTIISDHISQAKTSPDGFTLIGIEEEVALRSRGGQQEAGKLERWRRLLIDRLRQVDAPKDVIRVLEASKEVHPRALLACDLYYADAVTSQFLEKPAKPGEFTLEKLFDGENVLEFRSSPQTPKNAMENHDAFLSVLKEQMEFYELEHIREYEQVTPITNIHINFSNWQYRDGEYQNVTDPAHPDFGTVGANIAKAYADKVAGSDIFQKPGFSDIADVRIGPSREDALRMAGSGDTARIELRGLHIVLDGENDSPNPVSLENISTLINLMDVARREQSGNTEPPEDVSVEKRPILESSGKEKKIFTHALHGGTIADNGRILPNKAYITKNAHKLVRELGLFEPTLYKVQNANSLDTKYAELIQSYTDLINRLMTSARVDSQDDKYNIVFPRTRVNDTLPVYKFDPEDKNSSPNVRTVCESGQDIIEVSGKFLLYVLGEDTAACVRSINQINDQLSKVKLRAISECICYAPILGSADVYRISGGIENPTIEFDMTKIPPERRLFMLSHLVKHGLLGGGREYTRNEINGMPAKDIPNIMNYDIRSVLLRDKAALDLLQSGNIPAQALHRFQSGEIPVEKIPQIIFTPQFATSRKLLHDIFWSGAFINLGAVANTMEVRFLPQADMSYVERTLESLRNNAQLMGMGITISGNEKEGYIVAMPSYLYGAAQEPPSSLIQQSSPTIEMPQSELIKALEAVSSLRENKVAAEVNLDGSISTTYTGPGRSFSRKGVIEPIK